MLLSSTQVMPKVQHEDESFSRESPSLRHRIEELNRNTVLLIAEAGKLIQGSKELSDRLNFFEAPSMKEKIR
jgi:hypothetical protein